MEYKTDEKEPQNQYYSYLAKWHNKKFLGHTKIVKLF